MKYLEQYKLFEATANEHRKVLTSIGRQESELRDNVENSLIDIQEKFNFDFWIPICPNHIQVNYDLSKDDDSDIRIGSVNITKISPSDDSFEGYETSYRDTYVEGNLRGIKLDDLIDILKGIEDKPIEYFVLAASQNCIFKDEESWVELGILKTLLKRDDVKDIKYEFSHNHIFSNPTEDCLEWFNTFEFQDIFLTKFPNDFQFLKNRVVLSPKLIEKYPHITEGNAMGFFNSENK